MRKKNFLNFIMVAVMSVSLFSLSSCNDDDSDKIDDLKKEIINQNTDINVLIEAQKDRIDGLVNDLQAAKEECKASAAALENKLKDCITKAEADGKYATIQAVENCAAELATVKGAVTVIENNISTLQGRMDAADQTIAENQTKISDIETKLQEHDGKFESVEQEIAAKGDLIQANKDAIADLYGVVSDLQIAENETKAQLNQVDSALTARIVAAESGLTKVKEDLTALTNNVNGIIQAMTPKVVEMMDTINSMYGKITVNAAKIAALENTVSGINSNNAKLNTRIDSLASVTTELGKSIQTTNDSLESKYAAAKKYADDAVKIVADKVNEAFDKIDANKLSIDDLVTRVNAVEVKLGNLENEYKEADRLLGERIDDLVAQANALRADVDANTKKINDLNSVFKNVLNKQITSVVLQGAQSPVVGYFSLPTGVKSNILAAYYGQAEYDVYFPTRRTANYVFPEQAFTEQEAQLLDMDDNAAPLFEEGEFILADEGNAGTLYMTINPNSVDFDNTNKFNLVNSLGEKASVTLATPVKSTRKLSFGYTRSAADNGFYEAQATVTPEQVIGAKMNVDFQKIKGAIKDVLTPDDGVDVTNVISTIYKEVNAVADANAVEAIWSDSLGEHSVYSEYGIAATVVNPLSFSFMKDADYDQFPHLDKAYNFLDKIVNKLNSIIPQVPNFQVDFPKIDTIKITELSPELIAKFEIHIKDTVKYTFKTDIDVPGGSVDLNGVQVPIPEQKVPTNSGDTITIPAKTVTINGQTVTYDGQTVHVEEELSIPIEFKYDMTDAIEDLYGDMTGSMGDVNEMLKTLKKFMEEDMQSLLDEINGYGKDIETNIQDAIGKVESEVTKFLDKINNKLCNLLNSVNSRIQPTLLVKTTDDFQLISSSKSYPTEVGSSFLIVPTSYTVETVTPAVKKFVAITDVIKEDGKSAKGNDVRCRAVLRQNNRKNADLNAVLDGSKQSIEMDLPAGYVYEITYSALDYHGMIVNTKYYVKVK